MMICRSKPPAMTSTTTIEFKNEAGVIEATATITVRFDDHETDLQLVLAPGIGTVQEPTTAQLLAMGFISTLQTS